jgi:hypothetical protein
VEFGSEAAARTAKHAIAPPALVGLDELVETIMGFVKLTCEGPA